MESYRKLKQSFIKIPGGVGGGTASLQSLPLEIYKRYMSKKPKLNSISYNYEMAVRKLNNLRSRWKYELSNRSDLELQGKLQAKIVGMLKRQLDNYTKSAPSSKNAPATYEEAKEILNG